LEAYQKEPGQRPPETVELFVSVAYFKALNYAGTQQSWDALLREACPGLKLPCRCKSSRPYFDLARRFLKRAVDLEPEASKYEAFLLRAPVKGLLNDLTFLPSAKPQSGSLSDERATSPSTTLIPNPDPTTTLLCFEPLPDQQPNISQQQDCTGHTPLGSPLLLFRNLAESLTTPAESPSFHTPVVHQPEGFDQGMLGLFDFPTPPVMLDTAGMLGGLWASPGPESLVVSVSDLQNTETLPTPPMGTTERKRCDTTISIMLMTNSCIRAYIYFKTSLIFI